MTLAFNASGRFEARWVRLHTGRSACRFLPPDTTLELPVAHAEGRLVVRDEAVLQSLVANEHIAVRYVAPGDGPCAYPDNPNGSVSDIAGLTDPTGQILGLMPHPERFVTPTQHPWWTRRRLDREPDGLSVFKAAITSFRV